VSEEEDDDDDNEEEEEEGELGGWDELAWPEVEGSKTWVGPLMYVGALRGT